MLLANLTKHFSRDLLVLCGSEVASLLVFHSSMLHLDAKNEDFDDAEIVLDKATTHIVHEYKKLAWERNFYQ